MMGDLGHLYVDVPLGLERNPADMKVDHHGDFDSDIKREVLMQMQRSSKRMAQEELDEHQADQSSRMKQRSESAVLGGRPRKTMTEVLSDIAKMKRERQNQLQSVRETVEAAARVAQEECMSQVGSPPPAEITQICKQMQDDIARLCGQVEAAQKQICDFNIATVKDSLALKAAAAISEKKAIKEGQQHYAEQGNVEEKQDPESERGQQHCAEQENGEKKDSIPTAGQPASSSAEGASSSPEAGAPTIEQIRQALIESTKNAFREGIQAHKVVNAFRSACKKHQCKAAKTKRGGGKSKRTKSAAAVEAIAPVPRLVQKLHALIEEAPDDSVNVVSCKELRLLCVELCFLLATTHARTRPPRPRTHPPPHPARPPTFQIHPTQPTLPLPFWVLLRMRKPPMPFPKIMHGS